MKKRRNNSALFCRLKERNGDAAIDQC